MPATNERSSLISDNGGGCFLPDAVNELENKKKAHVGPNLGRTGLGLAPPSSVRSPAVAVAANPYP